MYVAYIIVYRNSSHTVSITKPTQSYFQVRLQYTQRSTLPHATLLGSGFGHVTSSSSSSNEQPTQLTTTLKPRYQASLSSPAQSDAPQPSFLSKPLNTPPLHELIKQKCEASCEKVCEHECRKRKDPPEEICVLTCQHDCMTSCATRLLAKLRRLRVSME